LFAGGNNFFENRREETEGVCVCQGDEVCPRWHSRTHFQETVMAKFLGKLFVPALLVAGLAAAPAAACEPNCYKTVTVYEKVCAYEVRQVPYTCTVTYYDECGRPYSVDVTRYRQVKVQVTKYVPVKKVVAVHE